MQKTYQRINWENYPSESTPINETNLNAMDYAVDELDNRVITHETTKATKTEVSTVITDVSFNENTGTFTFTRKNGGTITVDTILEKMMINFRYDYENQRLVITLDDGSVQYVDMSALLTQYEFLDSDTLAFSLSGGKITAIVKNGSIQEKHLRPEYLAAIKVESAKAESGAKASATSEANAKAYSEQAKASADRAEEVVGITYATEEKAGIVSPQDIYVNPQNGEMSMTKHTTSPTLTNSHAGGIKLNLGGVSEQKQYSGKNLFDINGNVNVRGTDLYHSTTEYNRVENGVLTSNVDTVTTVPYGQVFNGLKGKTITISADVVSLGTGVKASIYIFENNWYTSNSFKEIDKTGHISFKYTCTDNITVVTFGSAHGTGAQFTNIQVEIGDTATEYEPYVGGIPAPNPDYPQEIKSVVVSEIKSVGKNLFNINGNVNVRGNDLVQTTANSVSGNVLICNADASLTNVSGQPIEGVKGKTITVSADLISHGTGTKSGIYLYENGTFVAHNAITELGKISVKRTCVTDSVVVAFASGYGTGAQFTNIQVEFDEATTYEPYTESVVKLSEPITLNGIGESIDILTPENVKRRFYTERVTTYMLALKEVNYNDTNTKGFTIIPSKKCASGEADNIKCTIAIYGSGTEKNTCRIKDSESIAIFLDMGEFPSLSDFSNYLASNEVYITYELAEEITEPLSTAAQIALRGLKSFNTATYISTDSEVAPIIDAEYGTSKVGALAIENSLLHEVKDILLSNKAEQSDVDALNESLGNKGDSITDCNTIAELVSSCKSNRPFVFNANSTLMNELAGVAYAGVGYACKVMEGVVDGIIEYSGGKNFATFRISDNAVLQWKEYALNSNLTDYMVAVDVEFDFTEVDTFQTVSKDITSLIPKDYKVIDAHGVRGGGDYVFISDISLRDNTLSLALYNPSGNIDSGYPAAKIICVRDI